MGEIVHLQMGSCGNNIGCNFWESISQEHGLDQVGSYKGSNDNQLKQINVYFNESSSGQYKPRAILADLDIAAGDTVRAGSLKGLFQTDSYAFGDYGGTGVNYAKGYYSQGAEFVDSVMDVARKEAEACNNLQGFQLMHSLGGGTGSGMGSLLIGKIREEYPDSIMTTYSVVPSPKVSDTVVEPYNAVLSLNHLIDEVDQCFVLDNEALIGICRGTLKLPAPKFGDLNALITAAITGATCPFRFPSQVNGDLKSLSTNMIPFHRLHFLLMGCAPLASLSSPNNLVMSVPDLTKAMFNTTNILCAADPQKGKYLTCAMMYRGSMSNDEVGAAVHTMADQNSGNFVEWDSDKIKATICDIPAANSKASGMFIANTTCVKDVWKRISDQFTGMLNNKAYLHWYTGEGMDESEFTDAGSRLNDLINEYKSYEAMNAGD